MEAIFLTLLEVSAASAVVILIVVLLSSIINRSYTARWKYWLWMVLAARLLIPFNPSFETAPARVEVSIPAASISLPAAATAPAQPAQPVSPPPAAGQLSLPDVPDPPIAPAASAAPAITVMELLMLVWLAGAVLFLLWQTASYLRFRGQVRRWGLPVRRDSIIAYVRRQTEAEFGIGKSVPTLICKKVSSPMMIGFFRPLLILPHDRYSAADLSFILRHELTHCKRRDIWYKSLLLLANAVHWFNPAVWLMVREASRDLEISCDAAVMKNAGMEERRQYSETILACVHRELAMKTALSTHFYGGKKALKERFANILSTRKRRTGLLAFVAVLLCGALVGGLVACSTAAPDVDDLVPGGLEPAVSSGSGPFQAEPVQARDFQGFAARGTNESTVAPSQARIPNESDWAGEEQVREYQAILDGLDPDSVSRFVIYEQPSDHPRQAELTPEQAAEFIALLKSVRLAAVEPVNAYSGGTVSLHIVTDDDQLAIRYYGNLLFIGRRDQDTLWTFDGLSCTDIILTMEEMVSGLLENAFDQPETPLYFGLGQSGEKQALRSGDTIGGWRLESYDAVWDEAYDGGVQVYDACFTTPADAPVWLDCSVILSPYASDQRSYWFYVEEKDWERMPMMRDDASILWFGSQNNAVLGALDALGASERWNCRIAVDRYNFVALPMEAFSTANIARLEVSPEQEALSVQTVDFNTAILDMDGGSLDSYLEFAVQMPNSWTASGNSVYDEDGRLIAEVLPWIYAPDDSAFDRLDEWYPDGEPIDVAIGDLVGKRYRQTFTDAGDSLIHNEMFYYIRRYDYLVCLKFYPVYGIGIGTQCLAFESRFRVLS